MADASSEIKWVMYLLYKIGVSRTRLAKVWTDNLGNKYLVHNLVFHTQIKHMTLHFNYVRELVKRKVLQVAHISTKDQLADGLTKPLPSLRYLELNIKLGVIGSKILA